MIKIAAAVVVAGLAGLPGNARAEMWCMRQVDGGAKACVFSSGEDCSRTARLSAAGGICERESLPADKKPGRNQRPGASER